MNRRQLLKSVAGLAAAPLAVVLMPEAAPVGVVCGREITLDQSDWVSMSDTIPWTPPVSALTPEEFRKRLEQVAPEYATALNQL